MRIRTRTWVIIFVVIAAICLAVFLLLQNNMSRRKTAVVTVGGKVIRKIDLNAPYADYSFTVKSDSGYNTITVSSGKIKVTDADCRDRICVDHGWLEDNTYPIVCLPHRLIITYEGD